MNLKLDENIPEDAATIFTDAGYQVSTVLDQGLGGKADPEVAAACKAESKVLITLDPILPISAPIRQRNILGSSYYGLRIRQSRTCSQSLFGFWIHSDGNRHRAISGL